MLSPVSDETLDQWRTLARQVSDALNFAGVSAYLAWDDWNQPGARVEVDAGDDEAGGVFVNWLPSSQLYENVLDDTKSGRQSTPAHNLFGAVATHMQRAIIGILVDSGFDAVPFNDWMNPPSVHVLRRTEGRLFLRSRPPSATPTQRRRGPLRRPP